MWQEIMNKINVRNLAVRQTVEEVMKRCENISVTTRKGISKHQQELTKTDENKHYRYG